MVSLVIEAANGGEILIDSRDYDDLIKYRWSIKNNGCGNLYAVRYEGKSCIYMHRQIMKVKDGRIHIDHKNGNSLDNRRVNLRACDNSKNRLNSKLNKRSSTGYTGVRFRKDIKKYQSHITREGRFHHLGYFESPEEAGLARDVKALELDGEFVRFNFPERFKKNKKLFID